MPFNCGKRVRGEAYGADATEDIDRVLAIWRETRERFGREGPFLFGAFGIADAMYAPVALRFISHRVELDASAQRYVDALTALPALQERMADAATELLSNAHERMKP